MSRGTLIDLLYLVAAVTFILALKGLGSPKRARHGNMVAAAGMLLAVVATFFNRVDGHPLHHELLIVLGMAVGLVVAVPTARFVQMTAMPQLVAIFNGVGGGAACLVSLTEFIHIKSSKPATYVVLEVLLGVLIGTVSFSGSAIAFAKLQELMTGRPVTYVGQQFINALIGLAALVVIVIALVTSSTALLWVLLVIAFVLGIAFVLPIGGADVPVLISLLNSFTGLAVAASGFTLGSNLLIVAGTLVGASGMLLTMLMSKAMGRSLPNILFSAFGSVVTAGTAAGAEQRSVRSGTPEDVAVMLGFASRVVFIPGYGLAVAQAQNVLRELAENLEKRG
ncbi:MAG: NAD(P) transhydrogenase subunit beta, partial [Actinobacteria bacterium 21-73-9]